MNTKVIAGAVIGMVALVAILIVLFMPKPKAKNGASESQNGKTAVKKLNPQELDRQQAEAEVRKRAGLK